MTIVLKLLLSLPHALRLSLALTLLLSLSVSLPLSLAPALSPMHDNARGQGAGSPPAPAYDKATLHKSAWQEVGSSRAFVVHCKNH